MENKVQNVDKKSKIFYAIFFSLIIISVGATFLRYVVFKDYQIFAQASCDPQAEKCYMTTCDPADDSTCPQDESQRTTYYKIISKNASAIYDCENSKEKTGCNGELFCLANEKKCSYKYCDPANLADGEQCSQ